MKNPKVVVEVDGKEITVELLLLSSSRKLSDECFLQTQFGFERYRDWSANGEGWAAPDAQVALIRTSLNRAGVDFADVDADASTVVDAIVDAIRTIEKDDDSLDPTIGKSST